MFQCKSRETSKLPWIQSDQMKVYIRNVQTTPAVVSAVLTANIHAALHHM